MTIGQLPRERSAAVRTLVDLVRAAWVPRRVSAPPLTLLARDEEGGGPFRVHAEGEVSAAVADFEEQWGRRPGVLSMATLTFSVSKGS